MFLHALQISKVGYTDKKSFSDEVFIITVFKNPESYLTSFLHPPQIKDSFSKKIFSG